MQDLLMLLMFLVGSTAVFLFVSAIPFVLTYIVSGSRPARALRSFTTRTGDTGVWSPDEDGETKKVDD